MSLNGYILILTTISNVEEGKRIAKRLLEKKLVACVNIIPNVKSLYWWKGAVEEDEEVILIIKTHISAVREVFEVIRKEHTYELPEVIAIPIAIGSEEYLKWIKDIIYEKITR